MGGFSRNSKSPYLDSELSRLVLFPGAKGSAVVSVEPFPKAHDNEISQEDEVRFLAESDAATSGSAELDQDQQAMEVVDSLPP